MDIHGTPDHMAVSCRIRSAKRNFYCCVEGEARVRALQPRLSSAFEERQTIVGHKSKSAGDQVGANERVHARAMQRSFAQLERGGGGRSAYRAGGAVG